MRKTTGSPLWGSVFFCVRYQMWMLQDVVTYGSIYSDVRFSAFKVVCWNSTVCCSRGRNNRGAVQLLGSNSAFNDTESLTLILQCLRKQDN